MQLSPQYIVSIDSMIKALITSNWQRVAAEAQEFGRIMKVRPSTTRRELLTWILDTTGLYPQGQGGNHRYDDMGAVEFEIDNTDVGAALELTTNEIEDNQLARDPKIGAMDYAQKWARDRGAEAAYFPRKGLFNLILAGQTALGYDGLPFFSSQHPVNPLAPTGAVFSNIITGVGIGGATTVDGLVAASANFATALSKIRAQKFINNTPRFLKPTIVVAPTALEYSVNQLIGGGGLLSGGSPAADVIAQTTNVLGKWGFQKPIIAPELDGDPTSYYIGVEDTLSDELGAFIFSDRKPFELRGYPDASSAALNRSKMWEWTFDGRNAFQYGHSYLFYRCTT